MQNFYRDPSADHSSNVVLDANLPWDTLETLMDKTSLSSRYPTGLAEDYRRTLAVTLASSVLHLHGTGWLPEHWSKSCAHFPRTIDGEIPYVMAVFNASFCDIGKRSQFEPNPYGLGIALLELAQQVTFEDWVRCNYDIPRANDNLQKAYLREIWTRQVLADRIIRRIRER